MNIVAFIFARGGSKGLPGKNLRPLCGKPMIAWAIEQAKAVASINRVIVSTDCEEIAAVARMYGAHVPFMRPVQLAQDDSPEWLAWRHALSWLQEHEGVLPDVMMSVPATAPLRTPEDIDRCLDEYAKGDVDAVVTVSEANRNPYFNMVKKNADGTVSLVIPPQNALSRRQDAPEVFDMATVAYVLRPRFILEHLSLFEGRLRAVCIPRERSVDIDTLLDFHIAEFLMQARKDENADH
jgi:CMP-N-acetylneuraminic acid synthetase